MKISNILVYIVFFMLGFNFIVPILNKRDIFARAGIFGSNSVYDEWFIIANNEREGGYSEYQAGVKIACTEDCTIDSVSAYLSLEGESGDVDVKAAIYTGDGSPETVITNGESVASTVGMGEGDHWETFTFSTSPTLSASNNYFLVLLADADDLSEDCNLKLCYSSDTGTITFIYSNSNIYSAYPTFDSSWSNSEYATDGTSQVSMYCTYSGSVPEITIMYAGNPSDTGGPFFIPSLENGTPTANTPPYADDGYYTNNSCQIEDFIVVKAEVTNEPDDVYVCFYNYSNSSWLNRTMVLNATSGLYENTTVFSGVVDDAFTIRIKAIKDSVTYLGNWTKKGIICQDVVRKVTLGCSDVNISYVPLYHYQALPVVNGSLWEPIKAFDALEFDQGWGETDNDTCLAKRELPDEDMDESFCGQWVSTWYHNNTPVENFTLSNVYFRLWVSSNDYTEGYHYISVDKGRGKGSYIGEFGESNNFTISPGDAKSSIIYNNSLMAQSSYLNDTYILIAKKFNLGTTFNFCDNDMFEFSYHLVMDGGEPSIICNRSVLSGIIFNVPDNATLNASHGDTDGDKLSDWSELYVTFTSPFLYDTDNDGVDDFDETVDETDPNNYTDYLVPSWSNVFNFSSVTGGDSASWINIFNYSSVSGGW